MSFKENLPPSCPPSAATAPTVNEQGFRLLEVPGFTADTFKSHQELKPHVTYADPCRFRSVSLVRSFIQCQDAVKIQRMKKFKFAAEVVLQPNSGIVERDSPHHMNWWVSSACEPNAIIAKVWEL